MKAEAIAAKIRAAMPDARVELQDLTGTEDHWKAVVISDAFRGKTPMQRHRMVFAALSEEMKGPIHAFTLEALTPDQVPGQ
jgi:stress-induced morphogen